MTKTSLATALALACPFASTALAQGAAPATIAASAPAPDPTEGSRRAAQIVTITGTQPRSLPAEIPTTLHSATAADIERSVNATDSEDALKYFPSLLVRKRYIGDYNHAILSSRASGTGNSARSAVYADGILLSNYLGNGVGGLSFPPRWEMVTPEEIERVDVMYGPFSAAYPGNSVGAVVDYVTRMPTRFEAHAKADYESQPFNLYRTKEDENAWQTAIGLGGRVGAFAWWIDANHTDSQGQPLTFATRAVSTGKAVNPNAATPPTPVTGAVAGFNANGAPWWIIGTGTQYHTRQDHLKIKLAYDLTPDLRATYLFGLWRNTSSNDPATYLRDAGGNPASTSSSAGIVIDGLVYAPLSGADFAITREKLQHDMHGLSLKSHSGGTWDWEANASLYDYQRDDKRQNDSSVSIPAAYSGGMGTLADGSGTGWNTLAVKGTWRPFGAQGAHVSEFGLQQDSYHLSYLTSKLTGDWLTDAAGQEISDVGGKTRLRSLWLQDLWRFAPDWTAVLGGREEHWTAYDGVTAFGTFAQPAATATTPPTLYATRHVDDFSPKAALSWQLAQETSLKASVGRAVRMPTVSELYGATSTTNSTIINDPNLKPERSWTGELTAEQTFDKATARLTFFAEDTRDSIYSQTVLDETKNVTVSRVENVSHIATSGVEAAFDSNDWLARGLELSGSLTWADSKIRSNTGYVATPGDTVGKWQPNIPRWRATALASYAITPAWSASLGARYSGRQYRTLNNADTNGYAYMGVSPYFTMDVRTVWKLAPRWTAAFGIDNLNHYEYWNFHPYPQRTYSAELKYDL
jgi:iron complex outermembrane receptor protein